MVIIFLARHIKIRTLSRPFASDLPQLEKQGGVDCSLTVDAAELEWNGDVSKKLKNYILDFSLSKNNIIEILQMTTDRQKSQKQSVTSLAHILLFSKYLNSLKRALCKEITLNIFHRESP
ncbi:MAG: hypothetical protein WCZ86_08030 [Desulfurivibrionaceae bacterium]